MTSKLKRALGAVKNRTSNRLAKVSAKDSSNLDVTVLKATTHDDIPMEERYVQEILTLVSFDKSHRKALAEIYESRSRALLEGERVDSQHETSDASRQESFDLYRDISDDLALIPKNPIF